MHGISKDGRVKRGPVFNINDYTVTIGSGQPNTDKSDKLQNKPDYKRLYHTKRWRVLRRSIFARDGYVCQCGCNTLCVGKYPADNAPVCDHIIKHEGDEQLFWDRNNLQTLTRACHDGWKSRVERSKRMQRTDGW